MVHADLKQVLCNECAAYAYPWSEKLFVDCLRLKYRAYVALTDQKLIGHCIYMNVMDEAHLLNLCIHPDMQSFGLGRSLLCLTMEQVRRQGVNTVFLEVRPSNCAAVALYEHYGFNEIGMRRDYYPADQGREDARVMAYVFMPSQFMEMNDE